MHGPSYDTCANGVLESVKMRFWAICRQPFPYRIMEGLPVTRAVCTVIPIAKALALFYDCFFTRPVHIETARAKENLCRKDLEQHRNHA